MCPEHESQSPEAGRFSELDTGHGAFRSLPVPRDEPAVGHSVDLASRRLTGTRTGYSIHRGTSTVALRACREGHHLRRPCRCVHRPSMSGDQPNEAKVVFAPCPRTDVHMIGQPETLAQKMVDFVCVRGAAARVAG